MMACYTVTPALDEETGRFRLDVDNPPTDSGTSDSGSDDEQQSRWRKPSLIAASLGALAVVCIVVQIVLARGSSALAVTSGLGAVNASASRGAAHVSQATDSQLKFLAENVTAAKEQRAQWALTPSEDLNDGNVCEDDEELFKGLCYRKCSLLTFEGAPIRSSPWSCCKSHPCGILNQNVDIGRKIACSGYDVSGDGSCPHKPGACLKDEELYLGICYKKCSILTAGDFPHRMSAATCCKQDGLGCLDVVNSKTNAAFDVGGGGGDHNASTPKGIHAPQQKLTEASSKVHAIAVTTAGPPPEPLKLNINDTTCAVDEELYGGLCYKKCALLTYGDHPIRTSSWTCCKSHPCGLGNQKGSVGQSLICNGYDVGGDGSCPKPPKSATMCSFDEEPHLGICYKKCEILTRGEFPNRVAAATCCKTDGLGCLDIIHNDKTSETFDVGSKAAVNIQGTPKPLADQEMRGGGFLMQVRK